MAIYMIVGRPGAGKSFEAVRQWLFEAIKAERRVITNLSLNRDVWEMMFPNHDLDTLLEIRSEPDAFARPDHYGDWWKHPGVSPGHGSAGSRHAKEGVRALYLIDECHKALPKQSTEKAVIEWFKEHRHEGADVVLLTHEPRDISRSILQLVQCTYWCRNQASAGYQGAYSVTIRDGWQKNSPKMGGELPRRYDPKYFPLYQSYSKGGTPGAEFKVSAKPLHKRWWVKVAAVGLIFGVYQLYSGIAGFLGAMESDPAAEVSEAPKPPPGWEPPPDFEPAAPGAIPARRVVQSATQPVEPQRGQQPETPAAAKANENSKEHPFQGQHIRPMFSLSVNGGPGATYVNLDGRKTPARLLERKGYTVEVDRWGDLLIEHEASGRSWAVVAGSWTHLD